MHEQHRCYHGMVSCMSEDSSFEKPCLEMVDRFNMESCVVLWRRWKWLSRGAELSNCGSFCCCVLMRDQGINHCPGNEDLNVSFWVLCPCFAAQNMLPGRVHYLSVFTTCQGSIHVGVPYLAKLSIWLDSLPDWVPCTAGLTTWLGYLPSWIIYLAVFPT